MADSNQAIHSDDTLIDRPKVHMDRRGRLYVNLDELWRSRVVQEQLTEIAELSEELRAGKFSDKSE